MQKTLESKAALRQKRYRERKKENLAGVVKNEEKLFQALLKIAETTIESLMKQEDKISEITAHLLELRENKAFTDERLYEVLYRLQTINDVLTVSKKPQTHYDDGVIKLI